MRPRLVLIVFGILAGLLVAEIALLIAGKSWPRTMDLDPVRGAVRRPGQVWEQSDEGFARVRINSFGFRDREWATTPAPGVIRIAVIGDSYVEAVQVAESRRFTAVLDSMLGKHESIAGRPVEVMNFGVAGYGTTQELITFREVVRDFRPAYVLLAFMTGNDVMDNVRELCGDPMRPYFCLDGQLGCGGVTMNLKDRIQRLVTRASFRLVDNSRVAQLFGRISRIRAEASFRERARRRLSSGGDAAILELNWHPDAFREPQTPRWIDAWRLTEVLITTFRNEVVEAGARFLLVSAGSSIEEHPDLSVRQAFCRDTHLPSLYYPRLRLRDISMRSNIDYFDLSGAMAESAAATNTFYHGYANTPPGVGHWNENGHLLAGKLLSTVLAQRLELDKMEF